MGYASILHCTSLHACSRFLPGDLSQWSAVKCDRLPWKVVWGCMPVPWVFFLITSSIPGNLEPPSSFSSSCVGQGLSSESLINCTDSLLESICLNSWSEEKGPLTLTATGVGNPEPPMPSFESIQYKLMWHVHLLSRSEAIVSKKLILPAVAQQQQAPRGSEQLQKPALAMLEKLDALGQHSGTTLHSHSPTIGTRNTWIHGKKPAGFWICLHFRTATNHSCFSWAYLTSICLDAPPVDGTSWATFSIRSRTTLTSSYSGTSSLRKKPNGTGESNSRAYFACARTCKGCKWVQHRPGEAQMKHDETASKHK